MNLYRLRLLDQIPLLRNNEILNDINETLNDIY